MALVNLNFESQYLMVNHEVTVILPDKPREQSPADFYGSGKKYPVLWLLHGTFGDHSDWVRKTNIEMYATERNLVVVMPSALNSSAGETMELANPVMGTSVPAPAYLAMLSYRPRVVSNAERKIRLMDTQARA